VHDRGGIDDLQVEVELAARDDARDVEHVGHEPDLQARVAQDRVDRLVLGGVVDRRPAQQLGPAEHRGERCAQLVGHRREELVLLAVQALGFAPRGAFLDEPFSLVLEAPPLGGFAPQLLVRRRQIARAVDDLGLELLREEFPLLDRAAHRERRDGEHAHVGLEQEQRLGQ
jgi:hypothetical protein